MAATQPPPYPGFHPYAAPGSAPYPQQQYPQQDFPQQQYPQDYPHEQYPKPGFPQQQPFPQQQQYPQQSFPQQYPQQYPQGYPQQYPQQYPAGPQAGFTPFVPPVQHLPLDENDAFKNAEQNLPPGWSGFTDKAIRAVFVRKVYAILMIQLLFSLAVIALFIFVPQVKIFIRRHSYLYYVSYALFLGTYIALMCCGNLRRKYPTNVILLSIFTVAMSYMLGTISSFHDTKIVLMAVGICAGVCLAVSLFSFHSKFDFTSCGGMLFILVWVLFLFGIIAIFTMNTIMTTIYAALGALLFVMFLAYDTQMIMGGKKHELNAEEHIFAAVCLYLDVVYIFMFLLLIFGSGKSN